MYTKELNLSDLNGITGGTGETKPTKKFAKDQKVLATVGPATVISGIIYGSILWDSANETWLYNVKEENGNRYWNKVKEKNIEER